MKPEEIKRCEGIEKYTRIHYKCVATGKKPKAMCWIIKNNGEKKLSSFFQ